ncbi:MAG: LysR family transcriptional regulator [Pseudomonadota bacterium]
MRYWLELKTALVLSQLGTVSAASREIGVHRATINRRIDTLESAFQTRLFHRHARGFSLTDNGRDIIQVAARADEMFADLQARQRGSAKLVSGTLILTSVAGLAATVMPAITAFQRQHPETKIEFIAEARLLQLETGEAHIAFRGGPAPKEPDYVVIPFRPVRFGLYASKDYIERHGRPDLSDLSELRHHRFIGPSPEQDYPPYTQWIIDNVPEECIALRTGSRHVRTLAICHGVGIGFIDNQHAPFLEELVELLPPADELKVDLWIVTHVDLHRTSKVQAFLEHVQT